LWTLVKEPEGNVSSRVNDRITGGFGVDGRNREQMLDDVMWLERRIGSLSTLFSIATADHLGMNLADMLGLGILAGAGPITHGEFAALIGLSGGAVTGLVDRLERLDLVRRERDANDRRRVLLHLNVERTEEIADVFAPMQEESRTNLERFSDEELAVIARYNASIVEFMQAATRTMRSRGKAAQAAESGDRDRRGQ
jgi:DNA-binding MarR family transcriptional regulator